MVPYPKKHLSLFKNKQFVLLFLTTFIGQIASAFLVLTLIISLYSKTQSGYAVSGAILSFTIPGFFLMAIAGLVADIFDRRKIIIVANTFIALVVGGIIFLRETVIAATLLSTLYFVGNTFFLPAAQAATGQIAGKKYLLTSNVTFVFTFAGGLLLGFFAASVVHIFLGKTASIFITFGLLIIAAVLSYFLPTLLPKKKKTFSLILTLEDVFKSFGYIFSKKEIWFYFVIFAAAQGIIAFAATIAPGFFDKVLNLSFDRALLFVFPMVGLGAAIGAIIVNNYKREAYFFISTGIFLLFAAFLVLGILLVLAVLGGLFLFFGVALFLITLGIGDVLVILGSRIALQQNIKHNYQGTVFGANIILASLISSVFSIIAAESANTIGYKNTFLFVGFLLLVVYSGVFYLSKKWKL